MEDSSDNQVGKTKCDKLQRRLAQNREAARKSRLRKKAYIQQLETSRLKLAQLELEIDRTKQGLYSGSPPSAGHCGSTNSGLPFHVPNRAAAISNQFYFLHSFSTSFSAICKPAIGNFQKIHNGYVKSIYLNIFRCFLSLAHYLL